MSIDELRALAKQTAIAYQLDPLLVCAVIEQESGWDTNAILFEEKFYLRYVKPLNLPSLTESMARSFSWGLMQVMGQVAREHGFKAKSLGALLNPYAGLDIGCKVLRSKLNSHPSTLEAGLLAWNGGSNKAYPGEVIARMDKYKEGVNVV